MRKLAYFFFLGATFYLAGSYRLEVLNLLVFTSIFLFISLFFITRYFIKNIDAKIEIRNTEVKKGNTVKGKILVTNESLLPVTKFSIKIEYFNSKLSKKEIKKVRGYVPAKNKAEMEFEIKSKYCGILNLKVKEIKVYDYLSLFNKKKKLEKTIDALVLPSIKPINIKIENNNYTYNYEEGNHSDTSTKEPPEILWIDKYKQGDSVRDIHWKLSARNNEILTKKYSSYVEDRVILFIDLREIGKIDVNLRDTFYELCSSISLGLIKGNISHLVRWYDKENVSIVEHLVRTEEDYINMIGQLILKSDFYNEIHGEDKFFKNIYLYENDFENTISINLDLKLFLNNNLIMQFSKENYIEEVERRCITV